MFFSVTLKTPDSRLVMLGPGAIIGRMPQAALRFDDPRISEAHALVSLRGAELRLLALRGKLTVDGKPKNDVTLAPDVRVVLGGYLPLVVTDVTLPDEVPTVIVSRGKQRASAVLDGVLALHAESPPRLAAGFDPNARAIVWPGDAGAHVRIGGIDQPLAFGARVAIDDLEMALALTPVDARAATATLDTGRFEVSLTFAIHYDTVHIRASSGAAVVLDGLGARLLSELALLKTPVAWSELAKTLWEDEDDLGILRQRWDQATSRLRKKLLDARIRTDLIRANRNGLVELFLGESDRVDDQS